MTEDIVPTKLTRKEIVYGFCIALSVLSLVISSTTASKMYDLRILGLDILVPIGTSLFCFSFLATDIISEIWARNHAIFIAILGLSARFLAASFYTLAIYLPATETWQHQEAYALVLGSGSRILAAGVLAYFVASILDAFIYHYFRARHKGKNLMFLRNNISTFTAQLIGAITFVCIAFYGVIPNDKLFIVVLGNVLIKWLMALIDTPLLYIVRNYTLHKPLLNLKG